MAQSYTKLKLSASTSGRNILVAATATPGTLIHTATADPNLDEIWLYCFNADTVSLLLTLEWGGVTVPNDCTKVTINPQAGRTLVVDGKLLQGGLVVRAFAPTAKGNLLIIDGWVNRIV